MGARVATQARIPRQVQIMKLKDRLRITTQITVRILDATTAIDRLESSSTQESAPDMSSAAAQPIPLVEVEPNACDPLPGSVRDIGRSTRAAVKPLFRIQPWWNLQIVVFLAIWGTCAYIALHTSSLPLEIFCYLVAGSVIQGLGILMHDAVHGNLFHSRSLNRWVGFACGIPGFLSLSAFKAGHLPHHRYERSEFDPDEIENFNREPRTLAVLLILAILAGEIFALYRLGPMNALAARADVRRAIVLEYAIIFATFALVSIFVPIPIILSTWIYPVLFARMFNNVRMLAEHALTARTSRFTASRTVLSNRVVAFFMCNLNYHVDHHLFPGVPWYNLRKLHAILAPDLERGNAPICRSYSLFVWRLFAWIISALRGKQPPLTLRDGV
jgi:fatty acid desaturase